jgi:hypothetical protein
MGGRITATTTTGRRPDSAWSLDGCEGGSASGVERTGVSRMLGE